MKRTKQRGRRSKSDIRALVAGYENGDQSRAEYCATHGLAVTTLDYYRRRVRSSGAGLVEIDLQSAALAQGGNGAVAVVLAADLAHVPDHSQPLRTLLGLLEGA
jgi:hypothetical protein